METVLKTTTLSYVSPQSFLSRTNFKIRTKGYPRPSALYSCFNRSDCFRIYFFLYRFGDDTNHTVNMLSQNLLASTEPA